MHLLNFKNRSKFAILSIFILTLCFTFLTKTVYAEDRPVHTSITVNPANQSSTNVLTISLTADYNAEEYSDATIHYQWGSDIEKTALNSVTFDAISGHNVLTFWSTVYDKHGKPINEKKQKCDFYVDTIAPGLTLVIPVQGFLINQDSIIISGTAENSTTVQINNEPAFSGVGEFSQTVPLVPGLNTITVSDTDNSTKPPTVTIITRTGFYDNLPPVITLNGEDPLVVQVGGNFSDPGATASDNYDQNVTIIASGSVDTNTVGTYTITYSAADISGNQTTKTRTVEVVDNEAPVITLNGEDPLVVQVGSNFSDPGATASDNYDQNVTVIASGSVDTNTVGTYTITYSAEDVSGNKTTKTRTVKVVDSEAPVITLNGEDPLVAQIGSNFSDPGATASDNYDQNVIIIASGSVDTNTVGTYTITYSAADISGNQTTKTRTVEVVDNEAPVITLNGEDPLVVQVGSNFSDPGATASDNYDQNVTVIASGSVDINMVGSYTLTYSAIDSNGNKASSVTRVINVVNPIPVGPELTISSPREGENLSGTQVTVTGTVEVGASLKINGAMIYPAASGNFSKAITVNLGQNTIKVIATDTAGNVTEKDIPVIAPYVTVTTPADNLLTNQATVMVTGKVLVGTPLTINNTPVTPDASGNYSFPCTLNLADGTNTITVVAGTTTVIRNVTKDTTGPILTINSPTEGANLSGTQVTVTGTVEKGASLKINGAMVYPDGSGNFSKAITVNLGQNTIKVIATDTAGNVTEKNISVIAPYVTVTVPADNLLTNQATVVVTGKVAVGTELTINNASVTPDASDNYSYELALQDGTNTITVKAGTTIITRTVTQDTTGAPLTISSPKEGDNLSGTQVTVTGMVEVGASLKINGAMVYPDGSGNFSKAITVNLGQNTIKVIATDAAGNVTEKDISVIAPYVTVTAPSDNLLTNQATVVVTGKVAAGTEVTINDTIVTPDASGDYSYELALKDGTNTITVKAGTTIVTRTVTQDTTGALLTISSPKEGDNLSGTQVTITGLVEVGASLKINGAMVYPDGSGNFSKAITVNLGQNTIKVIATDAAGNVTEKNITVIAPYVTVTAPADNLVTNQGTVVVTGKVGVGTELTINDTIVTPDASGNYSFSNTLNLADGTNTITVVAGTTTVIRNVTKDTTGPILTINSPIEGENLSGTQVIVTGTVEKGASLKINGVTVNLDTSGNYMKAMTLNLGQNIIQVIATDTAGNVTEKDISVIAPYVTVTAPADNLLTNQGTVVVTGKVGVGTELTINDTIVTPDASGNYSFSNTLNLADGTNTITVVAGTTTVIRNVTKDTTGPILTINSPTEGANLSGTQITVTGTVEKGASLKINGAMVYPDGSGNFSKAITVNLGQNTIKVIATDTAGNVTEKNISVIAPYVTVTVPADNLLTNQGTVVVTGKVAVGTELTINDTVVIPDASGNYSYTYTLTDGTNTITVVAGTTTVIRNVTKDTTGPILTINSPTEGANLSGTQITVTGTVEVGSSLKINGAMVYPDGSGNFSKAITVNLGQNTIKVIATDTAGNVTEKDISVIAPYVTVTAPSDNLLTNQGTVVVTGKVAVGTELTINDTVVIPDASGNYSYTYTLADGTNTITVVAGSTTVTRMVTKDTNGPDLVISSPKEGENLSGTQVTVSGTVTVEVGASVKINGVMVYPDGSGNFSKAITVNLGQNTIKVIATDAAGNVTEKNITVIAPYVTVTAPADNLLTNQGTVVVTGKVAMGTALTINDIVVTPDASGNYSYELTLQDGTNTITVVAGTTTVLRTVTQDTTAPSLVVSSPAEDTTVSLAQITITGQSEVGSIIKVNNVRVYPDVNGNFVKTISLVTGTNIITVTATDAAGNVTTVTRNITYTI